MRLPIPNSYGTEQVWVSIFEVNPCHEPGGKPSGGEFCRTRDAREFLADSDKQRPGEAEKRRLLQEGLTHSSEELGGGVNASFKVRVRLLEDKAQAVFKPTDGETWEHDDSPIRDTITNMDFTLSQREVSAYEVDRILGLGVVPITAMRARGKPLDIGDGNISARPETTDDYDPLGFDDDSIKAPYVTGNQYGSMQEWMTRASYGSLYDTDKAEVYRAAILDFVIGNTDRHGANYIIGDKNKIHAIDNGLAFPDDNREIKSTFANFIASEGLWIPEPARLELAKRFREVSWRKWVNGTTMNDAERRAFMLRVRIMRRALQHPEGPQGLFDILFQQGRKVTPRQMRLVEDVVRGRAVVLRGRDKIPEWLAN